SSSSARICSRKPRIRPRSSPRGVSSSGRWGWREAWPFSYRSWPRSSRPPRPRRRAGPSKAAAATTTRTVALASIASVPARALRRTSSANRPALSLRRGMQARDRTPRRETGRRLSAVLAGSWRATPTAPAVALEELEATIDVLAPTGAGGLAWRALKGSPLAEWPAAERLHDVYRAQAVRDRISRQELLGALALLREEGLDPILGKGWAVARCYPGPGLRPCGDVDLYVGRDEHARAAAAAGPSGLPIDLHDGCPELTDRAWADVRERSRVENLDGHPVRVFGPEDHLRLVVLHFLRHGGWRPLWLCDVAVLMEDAGPAFD